MCGCDVGVKDARCILTIGEQREYLHGKRECGEKDSELVDKMSRKRD